MPTAGSNARAREMRDPTLLCSCTGNATARDWTGDESSRCRTIAAPSASGLCFVSFFLFFSVLTPLTVSGYERTCAGTTA